ncbi:hypothetical protein B0H10DRAFT_2047277 [Mycena sp. CBHHK59/15]|nr:hypothetical protein B0H10DRAFT_2047277 [Mycena sp. CBHHK59/15]
MDPQGRAKTLLIGPSIADAGWTPEEVWDTGFVDTYSANLAFLSVEKYPTDNCAAAFNTGAPIIDPQTVFSDFLNHTAHTSLLAPYLNKAFAQTHGKKMLMFETNTASCGGFAGISDAFGAALWGLDYALQMAHSNFSGAMFHVGGQNVFYNPFTSPPTNQSTFHQWTIGPIYYSALVAAETIGPSNTSQVLDLQANGANEFTPAYAIYEGGNPVRVALFNYITDASGASDVTAVISVAQGNAGGGDATPSSVKVKFLAAASVSQKGGYTWAGQTFGGNFESDGRLTGTEDVQTVNCDTTAKTCSVKVPAPGFALVFLTGEADTETAGAPSTTFATTALTKTQNTATVGASVLATSNGHGGPGDSLVQELGSTSRGSKNGALAHTVSPAGVVFVVAALGAALLVGRPLVAR